MQIRSILLVSLLAVFAPNLSRANVVNVHPTCNSIPPPCFTSIQAAVDAVTPPGEVRVAPNYTYVESVDLSMMNGGMPGDITLTTRSGRATIDAPPAQRAIFNSVAPFPGNVVISGFRLLSRPQPEAPPILGTCRYVNISDCDTDSDCGAGEICIDRGDRGECALDTADTCVTDGDCPNIINSNRKCMLGGVCDEEVPSCENSGDCNALGWSDCSESLGICLSAPACSSDADCATGPCTRKGRDCINLDEVDGDVTIENVAADDCYFDGVDIEAFGSVTVRNSTASSSGDDGFQIYAAGNVVVDDSSATDSRGFIHAGPDGGDNQNGFKIQALPGSAPEVSIQRCLVRQIRDDGISIEGRGGVANFGVVSRVEISDCTSHGNGTGPSDHGFRMSGPGEGPRRIIDVDIRNSSSFENTGAGFNIEPDGDVVLDGLTVRDNGTTPGDNGIKVGKPPTQTVSPDSVTARRLIVERNTGDGVQIESAGNVILTESRVSDNGFRPGSIFATGNGINILIAGDLTMRTISAIGNRGDGMNLKVGGDVAISGCRSIRNGIEPPQIPCTDDDDCEEFNRPCDQQSGFCVVDFIEGGEGIDLDGFSEDGELGEQIADSISIANCLVRENFGDGISATSEGPIEIQSTCIADNGENGVLVIQSDGTFAIADSDVTGNSEAGLCLNTLAVNGNTANDNNISGNRDGAILGTSAGITVDATETFWGSSTGPFHPTQNPAGGDNAIIDMDGGGTGTIEVVAFRTSPTDTSACVAGPTPAPTLSREALIATLILFLGCGWLALRRSRRQA